MKINESLRPINLKNLKIKVNDLKLEVEQLKEKQSNTEKDF